MDSPTEMAAHGTDEYEESTSTSGELPGDKPKKKICRVELPGDKPEEKSCSEELPGDKPEERSCSEELPGDKPEEKSCSEELPTEKSEGTSCSKEPTSVDEAASWIKDVQPFFEAVKAFFDHNPEMTGKPVDTSKYTGYVPSMADADEFITLLSNTLNEIAVKRENETPLSTKEASCFLSDFGKATEIVKAKGGNTDMPGGLPDIIMPMMHNIMQKLMSDQLLSPAMKDMHKNFSVWLEKNLDSLDEEQQGNYKVQLKLMKDVCYAFENMPSTTAEEKQARFERVFGLLERIKEKGNLPENLLGDMSFELPRDAEGNLKLPGMNDQCSVM